MIIAPLILATSALYLKLTNYCDCSDPCRERRVFLALPHWVVNWM